MKDQHKSILGRVDAALASPDCAPRLTLVMLAFYATDFWESYVVMALVAALGVVSVGLLRSPAYWCLIAVTMLWTNFSRLYFVDNHKLLMTYWCMAISMSRCDAKCLGVSARFLVGLCFALACIWKICSPDYLSGDFFAYCLVTEPRFQRASALIGIASGADFSANAAALAAVRRSPDSVVELCGSESLAAWGVSMGWWGLAIELAVALTMLMAPRSVWRNFLLILFVLSTYVIATVAGFGWLLAIMGLAQCGATETAARRGYVIAQIATQLFLVPWWSFAQYWLKPLWD